jgi:uncharacterized membrane protein YraQ (UPF0718 family)
MILDILSLSIIRFIKILPVIIIAIIASQVIKLYLHKDKIKKVFKENKKNIIKASAIGMITPGPLVGFLPLLNTLKEKGIQISIIATFITGQTLIGPGRIFFEINYFGITFFIYKLIISFFIAIAIGVCFMLLEKKVSF